MKIELSLFGAFREFDPAATLSLQLPDACRAVIEAVKHGAPIWKQEHYRDGDGVWSEGCSLCEAPHVDPTGGHAHHHDAHEGSP